MEVTDTAVAVNVALLNPALTVTLAGTVTLVLLLDSATLTALEGAALNVTVQAEVPGPVTLAEVQLSPLSWAAATRPMTACWLTPLRVAVTVAFWLVLTAADVAAKVALLCPDRMATLAEVMSNSLSLESDTFAALVAAVFNVTVQTLDALLPKVEGEQETELSCAGAVPVAVSEKVRETPLKVAVSSAV
ncbi:MAG: hypothetical protein M3O20_00255 [Acidobacteriota bacterium]|nr:hypothetical protein [Acidobacteriota bacterium]